MLGSEAGGRAGLGWLGSELQVEERKEDMTEQGVAGRSQAEGGAAWETRWRNSSGTEEGMEEAGGGRLGRGQSRKGAAS